MIYSYIEYFVLIRIWDISSSRLCRNHLLGEHRELHAMWTVITEKKKGYPMHPETIRWKGKLKTMYLRHEELVKEMNCRGYKHVLLTKEGQLENMSKMSS